MLQQKEDDCEESDAGIIVLTRITRSEEVDHGITWSQNEGNKQLISSITAKSYEKFFFDKILYIMGDFTQKVQKVLVQLFENKIEKRMHRRKKREKNLKLNERLFFNILLHQML